MFRPTVTTRIIIVFLWVVVGSFTAVITGQRLVYMAVPAVAVWLWFYFRGTKFEISGSYIIRHSGNIFKRKSIIMLKNIFYIQITAVAPWRPALVRLHGNGKTMIIVGLDGRQAAFVERSVRNNTGK